MNYEKATKELEKILNDIENKNLSIDKLLLLCEEGNKIAKDCQEKLITAEQKIKLIIKDKNKIKLKKIKFK